MQLFYTPDIESDEYTLSSEESRHAIGVLRLRTGDPIWLTDGRGILFRAVVVEPSAKASVVRVVERFPDHGRKPYRLHIAIALTKNTDRYEWFLEKATEIGVDRITPIDCDRSQRRSVKHERSEKVILSAVKQSLKAYVPLLDPLTSSESFIRSDYGPSLKFIAHCDEKTGDARRELFRELSADPGENYVVMIGPEGDFSPAEVELAAQNGFIPVSLGESRLRTETAGIMVASLAMMAQCRTK